LDSFEKRRGRKRTGDNGDDGAGVVVDDGYVDDDVDDDDADDDAGEVDGSGEAAAADASERRSREGKGGERGGGRFDECDSGSWMCGWERPTEMRGGVGEEEERQGDKESDGEGGDGAGGVFSVLRVR
jgi:hypothetical protein